jgi:hypothetical protein
MLNEEESGKKTGKTSYIFVSTPSLAMLEAHASFDYGVGFAIQLILFC